MTGSLPSFTVEQVPIDLLRPDPANPRRIGDEELDALERSIRQFGFVEPVLARKEDHVVIGGHQRLVAARRLGLATVPVTFLDLSIEQARLLNLALNRITGSWDEALLARLLGDLQATPDIDLTLSGFGEDEIADLLRSLDTRETKERVEDFDLDSALDEATRTPRTKPGDLWALGEHRLLCGDATKAEDVERLLGGAQAAAAFRTRPTTSTSVTTAVTSAERDAVASPTTPWTQSPGRASSGPGHGPCSPPWTAPSTSA